MFLMVSPPLLLPPLQYALFVCAIALLTTAFSKIHLPFLFSVTSDILIFILHTG